MTLLDLEKVIDHSFNDRALLLTSLISPSMSLTYEKFHTNRRLEFLGDSVLGMIVTELLYVNNPMALEGDMTQQRSDLVSNKALAKWGRSLKLDQLIMTTRKHPITDAMVADSLEALIGALYLDAPYEKVRGFVVSYLRTHL